MTARLQRYVRNGQVDLALHDLGSGGAAEQPLLLLHGLGEQTPAGRPGWTAGWTGPVWGLDFTGHGASTRPAGGGYTAEMLMADADAALAELGPSTVAGRGLGAYVALLVAGARPALVRGAVLADGPGLWGGGPVPSSIVLSAAAAGADGAPDPWALAELSRDVRPPDYATGFARQATQLSGLEWPVAVCARARPPWLEAVAAEPGVVETTVIEALELYAAGA
jgi:pimeloyl-ACP methyl ester carboxylesterase